jgi:hypothetical protein
MIVKLRLALSAIIRRRLNPKEARIQETGDKESEWEPEIQKTGERLPWISQSRDSKGGQALLGIVKGAAGQSSG